jgi:hypothetical protein
MPLKSLEHLAARTVYEALPANWNTFDLERFSPGKRLWDYQTNALKLALGVLWKFYDDFEDFTARRGGHPPTPSAVSGWRSGIRTSMHLTKKERRDAEPLAQEGEAPAAGAGE